MAEAGYELAQIMLWLSRLIRVGSVVAVSADHEHASVTFGGTQRTAMLKVLATSAGLKRHHNPIKAGEQVMVLSPNGELGSGVILRGLHSAANPQPSASGTTEVAEYPDGTVISYDWQAHKLHVDALAGDATLVIEAANLVFRIAEGGTLFWDHAGKATRVTHLGGNAFESESWVAGSVITDKGDSGFQPNRVTSEVE